ncbi:Stage II sporulation protein E (SpoIIE) [Desulfotomaculum arcticum]|uniref:Stage II sporulation protein E (SpoIIE) n=1 Tax=Desulfotruncus arcticus DSM 17038 TaxID=1121424 RepID=A0A1I2US16_9FIRM|nr:SpoIIE family protein phosphatase [Desulfotruncus arcticus]SFG77716.1 Stage II sporulation protein E (SpoIIE) [Desulfotomaculum arcticum] [Desulfotruncus arcticus DSM 17038]
MKICVDIGTARLVKYGEELCGDSIEVVHTGTDHIIVVADGLGSGVKANILSRLTAKTASTMLKMGGRIEDVMETLGQTLPICRVRKLAYSTFTVLQLKQDGCAYLIEYENPAVFFGRHNTIIGLETNKRNIGGKVIRESFFNVHADNWLVIVSDGVLYAGAGKTWDMGLGRERMTAYLTDTFSMQKGAAEWAGEIACLCNNIYAGKPGDDASIAVIKVRRPKRVTVLIGPPQNKEEDIMVVDRFMRSEGVKVVCGGTTGNIVGRVLGRNVRVDLSSRTERVPPVGIIPGIDLVTEGAITLVDALDLLKSRPGIKDFSGRDGASRLAALLAAADSVHFIIGQATNPGQQGTGVPTIYIYKRYIIRDLIRVLQEAGKTVTEEYH